MVLKIIGILIGAFLVMGFAIVEPAKTMPPGLASIYALAMGVALVAATGLAIWFTVRRRKRSTSTR